MHIKANNTVFDTNRFPVFFPEDEGISFVSLDTAKLHIRLRAPHEMNVLFNRIVGAIANSNRGLLDLDRDFDIIDAFVDHMTPMVNKLAAA
jgi:hypothetical protein